jgi:magnesium-protoporphyrin IX monomethyl ester (oxidative) cyclase
MSAFHSVVLAQAHPVIPVWAEYYLPDLVELCMLAAAVRPLAGEVSIPVHPNARDPLGDFERHLNRLRPDLVGLSVFTCGVPSALRYAEAAKRSGAMVVVGGYHPSALPEEMLNSPCVDWVVRGEGEAALAELVRSGSPEGVAGVSFRRGGIVVHNPPRAPIPDLNALAPPWREIRPERCGRRGLDYHTDTIYASRGCKGRCVFCANHLVGGPWRERCVEGILAELLTLPPPRGRRPKKIKFWDSSFLADAGRVERLCRGILEHGLQRPFRFIAESRAEDIVRAASIIPLMKEAGFVRIGCGIESPHKRTHATMKKGLDPGHLSRAVALLQAVNIQFSKFYILGHEGEDEETIRGYPEEALKVGFNRQHTTFFIMTPYPGTELGARYEERGLIAIRDWSLYNNLAAVVSPEGIPPRRLQVLHAGVVLRHKAFRRFLDGNHAGTCLGGLWEPLLLLAVVQRRISPGLTPRELAQDLHDALHSARGEASRPSRPDRPGGLAKRFALRFHLEGRPSVWIGGGDDGTTATMAFRTGAPPLPGRWEVHLDLQRLASLAVRLDHRLLANDALTLFWTPTAFRLLQFPSFMREVGKALAGLAGMAWFHCLAALGRRP